MLLDLFENSVAPRVQVADAARRTLAVPIVTDRVVREHVHMERAGQLVSLARVADALRAGSGQLTATGLQFMRDHARARRRSRCT